jgi:hypothetical protein
MQFGFTKILRVTARAHSGKRISFSGLNRLVMLGKVETFALTFCGHPERQEKFDKFQKNEGYCPGPDAAPRWTG